MQDALGLKVDKTVGKVLDEFLTNKENLPTGIVKEQLIDQKLTEILVEEKGYDLLVMGQGEGPGCYCYPNTVIRNYIDKLSKNYKWIVIDNEAGMEHISRRTNGNLDVLLLISDETIKGIRTCGKLQSLTFDLKLDVKNIYLVINKLKKNLHPSILEEIENNNLKLLDVIPEDENIIKYDIKGRALIDLPQDSPSIQKINKSMEKML